MSATSCNSLDTHNALLRSIDNKLFWGLLLLFNILVWTFLGAV